jgi:thermitase
VYPYMKKIIVALAAAVLLTSSFSAMAFAAPPVNPALSSDLSSQQILVKFKPDVTLPEAAEMHRQLGGQVKGIIPGIEIQVVTVPKGQAKEKAKAYSANARVAYAEPDFVVQALDTPDDPGFVNQRGMVTVGAPQAWDVTTGSRSINIAILDTGVDLDHPDLASKIVENVNFSSSATVDDVYGHGTHVAGIAAAMTNNGIGVAGLGYSATIMNVKVLGDNGQGYWSGVAQGIIWAADNGAEVISMSLGGSSGSSAVESAINYAWNKGVVVVAAAGNDGTSTPGYPAYYTNCMAVAATDSIDRLAPWSNRGDWVDVAAPGVSVYSTLKDGSYGYKSGTSMAAPHVAGLAALVLAVAADSNRDGRLNDEVRTRIESTCDDVGVSGIGSGRINAYEAVAGGAAMPVPATGSITGKVTDATDAGLIVGATVSDGVRAASTDTNGQFLISDIPEGSYTVTASAAGYSTSCQAVSVVVGESTTADFVLTRLAPPAPKKMWVDSFTFGVTGKNLRLYVKVVSESGAVAAAQVAVQLTNGVQNWSFSGATDTTGLVSFMVNRPPAGTYVASVTDVAAADYIWDATRGFTSASYTINGGGRKK